MKNLRTAISSWFDTLDEKWRAMPVKKQHRYTLLLFAGYALLSLIVLLEVCYDVAYSDSTLTMEHIQNPIVKQKKPPVSPQDSITTILKNQLYETCPRETGQASSALKNK